ncbi:MAG: glycosyltransferase [Candidatus Taylorbacteria bacterium]
MKILSNGFPTNLPNSEVVSQGGPANFAKLFYNSTSFCPQNSWIGVMFKKSEMSSPRMKMVHAFFKRTYYQVYLPKDQLKSITQANAKTNPDKVLKSTIDRLADFMKEEKPDIVFLNGFGVYNWILLKAAQQAIIPVVVQHAGILTKELDIHKHFFSLAGKKIIEEMEKDSTRLTNAEIFLNDWSKKYYCKNVEKRKNEHSYIIPLPFDFLSFGQQQNPDFQSISSKLDSKKYHIGVIARWDEIKNHSAILALAKEIKRLELPWQIYVVSNIPNSDPRKMEYEKYISIIPQLNRVEISDFCRGMDLLIQPSVFDVSPTVVLEATSSNTPIAISDNVGYVGDFLSNGAKDWVIDWSNASEVVKKISKIKDKKMPQALKRYLTYRHDHTRVIDAYIDLFAKLSQNKI